MPNRLINRNTKTITFSLPPEMAEQLQDVVREMREAASWGFFLASNAPFGYRKNNGSDGAMRESASILDLAKSGPPRQ